MSWKEGFTTLVLERSPHAVVVVEGQALIVRYANPRAVGLVGQGRLSGNPPLEVALSGIRPDVPEMLRAVLRRGEPAEAISIESRAVLSAAGEPTYWHVQCWPLGAAEQGSAPAAVLIAQDVTDQVRLHRDVEARARALEEREAILQLALTGGRMGVWLYDYAIGTVQYTASLTALYQFQAPETSVEPDEFFRRIHPEDREPLREHFRQSIETGDASVQAEFRIIQSSGEVRWIVSRARVERNGNGQPIRLIGIDVDMTAEHELRARLERSNQELERFAATVAHDLKSPLNTLTGFSSVLARSATERLNDAERKQLDYIVDAGQQMGRMLDGLFASALARQNAPREAVDLTEALSQCFRRLEADIRQAGAVVTHSALPTVIGNRVLLTQALQNLIANAVKYRSTRQLTVHVGAEPRADEWVISVRDNGIGVEPDRQAHIFEAFERGARGIDHPGLGLGLALVKGAVERHGGRVWMES